MNNEPTSSHRELAAAATLTTLSGQQFTLRPVRPSDALNYKRLVSGLSPDDRRYRFFSALQDLPDALCDSLINVDHTEHEAFVAVRRNGGAAEDLCGVVRLIKDKERNGAEYAIVVSQHCRNMGLGYSLMLYAIDYARYAGFSYIHADVLADNRAMLKICGELGFESRTCRDDSTVMEVRLTLKPSPDASLN